MPDLKEMTVAPPACVNRSSETGYPRELAAAVRIPLDQRDAGAISRLHEQFRIFRDASGAENSRADFDALIAKTAAAPSVAFEQAAAAPARGWWCRPSCAPADGAILYLHGGGYVQGSARAYRGFGSLIASRAGIPVFILEYPLGPEHPFPAAFETALAVYSWLVSELKIRVAIVGDSAGGGLGLALLSYLGCTELGRGAIAGVAFSPWTDLSLTGASCDRAPCEDPLIRRSFLEDCARRYLAGADPRDKRASPLFASLHDLPRLYVQVGSEEILLDDSRRFAEAATDAGVEVRLEVWEGLHHVFPLDCAELYSSRHALDRVSDFLRVAFADDRRTSQPQTRPAARRAVWARPRMPKSAR
jgi:acetyl esterase/lipase